MKIFVPLSVLAVLSVGLFSFQDAHAESNILDEAFCETMGGTWNSGTSTCTITTSQYTIPSGDELIVPAGTTLEISETGYSYGIENSGTTQIELEFLESLEHDVMAIKAIDQKGRTQITYLNEGIQVIGQSLNEPETILVASADRFHRGLVELTQIGDRWDNTWQSEDGYVYKVNQFGTFLLVHAPEPEQRVDTGDVNTRNHSSFDELMSYEANRAKYAHWNADNYLSTVGPSFTYEFPDEDSRTQFLREHGLLEWARGN